MLIPGWRDRSDRVDVALFESNSYVRVDVRASLAPVDAAAERFFDQQGQAFQDKWRHLDKYIEYSTVLVRESGESIASGPRLLQNRTTACDAILTKEGCTLCFVCMLMWPWLMYFERRTAAATVLVRKEVSPDWVGDVGRSEGTDA